MNTSPTLTGALNEPGSGSWFIAAIEMISPVSSIFVGSQPISRQPFESIR